MTELAQKEKPEQKLWDWPLQNTDGVVRLIEDQDHFEVGLDASFFTEKEMQVQVIGNLIEVNCDHEEKSDRFGTVKRSVFRCYQMPEDVDPKTIKHALVNNVLMIRGMKFKK